MLGISHTVYLKGISVNALPFAAIGSGFYFKVVLKLNARWRLGCNKAVCSRHG